MRVLHVISGLMVGGAETMLAKVLQENVGRQDARVISLTSDGPIGERIRSLGVQTRILGMRRSLPDPRGVFALAREIRSYGPDVVQTWLYHADLMAGLAAKVAGRPPVIWGVRNSEMGAGAAKWTTRMTLRACALLSHRIPTKIVANSERARDCHVALGYDPSRFIIIPNGFDTCAFAPAPTEGARVREELRIPSGAPLVGMVARYHPMKDFRCFARAAGLLLAREPAAWFVLCGDGVTEDNTELVGWLEEAKVRGRTRLLGRRSDVHRVLAALDLFTLSSVSEGFPNALGEAMACGIPCVTTDVGDCRQILGDAGRTIPAAEPEALADAWADVLCLDPEARAAFGLKGRARITAEYSIAAAAARFRDVHAAACRRNSTE